MYGPIPDQLADICMRIRGYRTLDEARRSWRTTMHQLRQVADQVEAKASWSRKLPDLEPQLAWMDRVVNDGPFVGAEAGPLRAEVLELIRTIRETVAHPRRKGTH